ncbi:MAG: nucleotidyltransferase domain-containing protein [Gemmatimonadaceae bacterium]
MSGVPSAVRHATAAGTAAERDERETADRLAAQGAWIALLRGTFEPGRAALTARQWSYLAEEGIRHQLSGVTYRLLADGSWANETPDTVLARLRSLYVGTATRNALYFRQTSKVIKVLASRGIPVMLLKGIHLARFTYHEPGLRSMADVDIMVRREHLAETEQVFLDQGYGPRPRPNLEEFCSWSNHLAKLTKEGAPVVEVHWGVERPTSPFRIDVEGLWERSQSATLDGAPVELLGVEDLLLHLVLHCSYHHRFDRSALKGMADIHAVVLKHESEINWHTVADRAASWGASGFTYTTLRLNSGILGTPVPEFLFRALPHERKDEELVDVVRRYILLPELELPKVYVKLAHSTGVKERATLLFRSVFLPRRKMKEIYGHRATTPMIYGYYGLRLASLLIKRGSLPLRALFRTRAMRAPIDREEDRLRIERWVGDLPGAKREEALVAGRGSGGLTVEG